MQNYTLNGIEINGSDMLTVVFNYIDSENNKQATADSLEFDYFSTNYNMVANTNDTLNLFSGFTYRFYDSGGKNGNYSDYEYNQLIVNAPKGKLVQATFNSYDIEGDVCDFLEIIDGTDVSSEDNLLDVLEFTYSEASLVYTATEANGGALNFVFKSDDSETHSGWEATLTTINIEYTITYNLNDGTNDDSNPDTYTVESATITLADASKEDFAFAGWYSDAAFENEVTQITKGSIGDMELYAKFLEIHTITYNLDNGTNDDSNPDTYTVESDTITLAPASKEGFTFAGWYSDATFENEVTQITTGNVELWAKWEEIDNAVETAQAPAPFTRLQNTLYFAEPTAVEVYSISGVMLYSGETMEYTLPSRKGIYIIHTFAGAYKVINY